MNNDLILGEIKLLFGHACGDALDLQQMATQKRFWISVYSKWILSGEAEYVTVNSSSTRGDRLLTNSLPHVARVPSEVEITVQQVTRRKVTCCTAGQTAGLYNHTTND